MVLEYEWINAKFDYNGSYDLDNNDLRSYKELSNAFSKLHDDMTSLSEILS